MTEQRVAFEWLDNELVKSGQFDDMVDFGQDLRDVALERCLQLQQEARRGYPLPVSPVLRKTSDRSLSGTPVNVRLGHGLPFTRATARSRARDWPVLHVVSLFLCSRRSRRQRV